MNCVDWHQASACCAWSNQRLPTEEEWEYAARGSEERAFPWGWEPVSPDRARVCAAASHGILSWCGSARVGSFPRGASPLGVEDLIGNVAEWTSTEFCPYDLPHCKTVARAIRGSVWERRPDPTFRTGASPSFRDATVGFRCASD